jgi:putative nucleotidyltransferase with HDIG domain
MISRRIFRKEGDDVFMAAILHDIGLIVMDQIVPNDFRKACLDYSKGEKFPLFESENQNIGTNHTEVSWMMAKDWKLPEEVVDAIRNHHDYVTEYPIPSVISILQLAEFMACKLKRSIVFDTIDPLPSYLESHVKENIAEYRVLLKALPDEMNKAEELFEGA